MKILFKRPIFTLVAIMLVFILGVQLATPVFALSDAQKQIFDKGVYYYDTDSDSTACAASTFTSSSSSNVNYAGKTILAADMLKKVAANQAVYEQAAQQVKIPWQLLAAVHYRETGFSLSTADAGPDGQYQIVSKNYTYSATLTTAQFLQETLDAANFLKTIEPSLSVSPDDATIKEALGKYNGLPDLYAQQAKALGFSAANQAAEGSPYVMNLADAKRDNGSGQATSWLQSLGVGIARPASTDQFGGFLVYAALNGAMSGGGCASGNCIQDPTSNPTADLSGVRQQVVCTANQELQKWTSGQLSAGSGYLTYSQNRKEDWCADFASWVYAQAGYPLTPDGSGSVSAVATIHDIGNKNQNFHWHDVSGYTPQPGDLAIHINDHHVNIVVGVSGDQMTLVGGNQGGGDFNQSKVTQYGPVSFNDGGDVSGFVSPD